MNAGTDDVGGHQVGRELDTSKGAADDASKGFHRQRLGHARNTLEEHVTLGQQPDKHPLHELVLADDDPFDLEDRPLEGVHLGSQPVGAPYMRLLGRRGCMPALTRVNATCCCHQQPSTLDQTRLLDAQNRGAATCPRSTIPGVLGSVDVAVPATGAQTWPSSR